MDDKQIAALVRKNAAKAMRPKNPQRKTYDATLDATRPLETEADVEAAELFSQMKKREF